MATSLQDPIAFDIHCHISPMLQGEDLIGLMDQGGVRKAGVFPVPTAWGLPGAVDHQYTNDYIAEMQRKFPDRFVGFAYINPHLRPGRELERCVRQLGLRALKIHPEVNCFTVDGLIGGEMMEAVRSLQKAVGLRLPILCHGMTTFGCMPDQFGRLAGAYPDVTIIIAHGGGFQNLYFPSYKCITEHENLFVDTAMTTIDDQHFVGVAKLIGIRKVLFGTDHFTRGHRNLYGNFRYVLNRAVSDPAERAMLFGGNWERILATPV